MMNQKKMIAFGAILLALLLVGWEWKSFRNNDSRDADNLNKQLAASGMGKMGAGGMPDPQKMQDRMMDNMAKQLSLTDAQKDQIKPIQSGMFPKMGKIFQDQTLSQEEKMKKMQTMQKENETQIRSVLTPEQQTRYDTMQKQMRDRMGAMRGGGMPGGMGGGMMPPGGQPGQ